MKGKNNEDRYAVSAYYVDEGKKIPSIMAVVSDGIGGHRAGEVAAEIAVEKISQRVAQSDAGTPLEILQTAISEASLAVRDQSEVDPTRKGMGATCACAWIIGDRLYIATVGDSRIYLERNGDIHKLTTDHTWIQEALEQGVLTPEQARGHPNAHVIRRYLGSQQPVEADVRLKWAQDNTDEQAQSNQGLQLSGGDILLLCSDGLTDLVEDHEIGDALHKKHLEDALKDLVNLANERGGHDNITIVAMKVPKIMMAPSALPRRQERNKNPVPVLFIVLGVIGSILVLAILGFAGFYFLMPKDNTPTPSSTQATTPPRTQMPVFTATTTPTGTITPTPTLLPSMSTTPPTLRVTRALVTKPSLGTPTYTPWPTSTTQASLDISTASVTPQAP
jgi:protein phosphatase